MSEQNPYESPIADLGVAAESIGTLGEPQHRPASSGLSWISEAFSLFKRSAGIWIALTVIYLVLSIAVSSVPMVGILWLLIAPVFSAGLFWAARETDIGSGAMLDHLFVGFKRQLGNLVLFGVLVFLLYIAVFVVALLLAVAISAGTGILDLQMLQQLDESSGAELLPVMLVVVLFGLVLIVPVLMAQLFGVALIIFHEMPVVEALKTSFKGCSRNLGSLTVWSLVLMVLFLLGAIPLLLGLLVVYPVLLLSVYVAYRDIFLQAN